MDYRQLGRSRLRVSSLTLGTMGFGGGRPFKPVGELGADDARRQFDLCLDQGVNLIDTANMYSAGRSEEIVGEALEGRRALGVSDARGYQPFAAQQIHYTPQAREAEFELVPAGIDQGVGTLVWSPLAGGLLSGKYRRGKARPEGTRHVVDWDEPPVHDEDKLYDIVEALVAVGEEHGVSAAQVTLAWLLTRPTVSSLVIAARTDEQLADNLAAARLRLTQAQITRIEEVSRPDLPYPLWHQAANARDRLGPADAAVLAPWL